MHSTGLFSLPGLHSLHLLWMDDSYNNCHRFSVDVIKLIMMRHNILLAWYPSEKDCCTKYCDIGTKITIFNIWFTQHLKCYIALGHMLSLQNQNAICKFQTLPTCQIRIFHFSAACLYDHFASQHRIVLCPLLGVNKHFAGMTIAYLERLMLSIL